MEGNVEFYANINALDNIYIKYSDKERRNPGE